MARVPIRTDLTVEQVFDAVTERAGHLTLRYDGQAIDAFLAVARFLMESEGREQRLTEPKYRLGDTRGKN